MKLLAFDYGASSGRGILGLYEDGKLELKEVHRFSNDPVQIGNTLHWDTLRLLHELKQGIVACNNQGNGDLSGIGIDTWGVDFGLIGKKGTLVANPVHYRDDRTKGQMEKAFALSSSEEIYRATGIQFMEINTLYHLMALKEQDPELLEQTECILFTPDMLQYFLTGNKVCEATIASTSQMMDATTGQWATELLEKLGVPTRILLPVTQPLTVTGTLTPAVQKELDVGAVPVIAVGGHDTASAVVSVPAENDNFAYLSSGTWSLMGVELDHPVLTDEAYRVNVTNEGGVNHTTRLLKNIMGLWVLQECKRWWDKHGDPVTFAELETQAREVAPFQFLVNVDSPEFGKPGQMPSKIQDYCRRTGQPVPQTKGEITRCVYESLAMKYRSTFAELESLTGRTIPVLHIVGGGSKDMMLNTMTADALNKPVMAGPNEATAIGNLLCQLMALGTIGSIQEARDVVRRSFPPKSILPQNPKPWDDAYAKYVEIVAKG